MVSLMVLANTYLAKVEPYSPTRGSHLAGDFDIRPFDSGGMERIE